MGRVSPKAPTLDELLAEMSAVLAVIEELEADDLDSQQKAEELLEDVMASITLKIDGYIQMIKKYEDNAEICDREARRLAKLASSDNHKKEWLKNKLKVALEERLESTGKHDIRGFYHKVWLQQNGGCETAWIDPELQLEDLDEEYIIPEQIIIVPAQVDYVKLKEDAITFGQIRSLNGKIIAKRQEKGKHIRYK